MSAVIGTSTGSDSRPQEKGRYDDPAYSTVPKAGMRLFGMSGNFCLDAAITVAIRYA